MNSSSKKHVISGVRVDEIEKNAVDHFSISLLTFEIFALKFEKFGISRLPSCYANEGGVMSQRQKRNCGNIIFLPLSSEMLKEFPINFKDC